MTELSFEGQIKVIDWDKCRCYIDLMKLVAQGPKGAHIFRVVLRTHINQGKKEEAGGQADCFGG